MRRALLLLLPVIGLTLEAWEARDAAARPPRPPDETSSGERRPPFEWSTWVRVAWGTAPDPDAAQPRILPGGEADLPYTTGWEAAVGAELSLPLTRKGTLRVGPWIEARTSSGPVAGGQLVLAARPAKLDMFWYEGEGLWMLRAGGNADVVTGAIAYGYRAPWDLFRAPRGSSRYTIGVRVVGSVTRSLDDPRRWSATIGLETEPLGALRYLLGIQSWYR